MKTSPWMLSVLCACLIPAGCTSNGTRVQQEPVAGVIRFAEKMKSEQVPDDRVCEVRVPAAGSHHIQDKLSECGNDVASWVKFENVPSSTQVQLLSERSCSYNGDWFFSLLAIKNPTTSLWFYIPKLKSAAYDQIMVPGVVKNGGRFSHGEIKGKLSCAVVIPPEL